jgi:hypothetical protein
MSLGGARRDRQIELRIPPAPAPFLQKAAERSAAQT